MQSLKAKFSKMSLILFSLVGILWGVTSVYHQYQALERGAFEGEGVIGLASQRSGKIAPIPKKVKGDPLYVVLNPDAIPAIDHPQWVPASSAKIGELSPVIGVTIKGESHAYSLWLLNHHEIVNDVVGGEPIAVTW